MLAALAVPLMLGPTPGWGQGGFSEEQRQAIGTLVREYLLRNPEVLQEAFQVLQEREAEIERSRQAEALRTEREKLFSSPSDYVLGNPGGDVTLVEFLDYNCAYCKKAVADIKALLKSDPKLRVVLKEFPILGPDSVEASRVALAAKGQLKGDKVLEFHSRLMESRGVVNGDRARTLAREIGLDMTRLEKDLQTSAADEAIRANLALGEKLGISGTPGFVVGDAVVAGAVGTEPLRKAIANVRSCGKAAAC